MSVFGKRNGGGRRRAQRESAPAIAVYTTVTKSHAAVLIDLSTTGARLRSDDLPNVGEELMISVETIRAFGCVAWVDGNQFGIGFDEPVEDREVLQLRRQLARSKGLPPEVGAAMDDWRTGLAR